MYHIFFIHSSINGHLDFFHVLAIVKSAAMNIEEHGSFRTIVLERSTLRKSGMASLSRCQLD